MKIALYILGCLLGLLILYGLTLLVAAALVDTNKEYKKHNSFYRWLVNSATFVVIVSCRIKIKLSGAELLPEKQRFLLISNHRAAYDPLVTYYTLRKYQNLSFVSKPENFNLFIFGRLIRRICFLPIDRDDPKKAMRNILQAAEFIKDDQVSMGVYPEGTRSHNGEMGEFHNGVIKIAQKAKAPMVVCSISGTEKIHGNAPWRRTEVKINILKVVPVDEIMSKRSITLGEEARELILKDLEK